MAKKKFEKMVNIPNNATRCVVRARKAMSTTPSGTSTIRTITYKGKELCWEVALAYKEITTKLNQHFGGGKIGCFTSTLLECEGTMFELLGTSNYMTNTCLDKLFSMKNILGLPNDGEKNWLTARRDEGWTMGQLVSEVYKNPELLDRKLLELIIDNNYYFQLQTTPDFPKVIFAVDNEPTISLTALSLGAKEEEIGLEYCQALIFFYNKNEVVSVQKFDPLTMICKIERTEPLSRLIRSDD